MIYSAIFDNVTVTNATGDQDFFELLVPSDAVIVLHQVLITQSSDAGDIESEQLRCTLRRVSGAPTSGSGGTTPTPVARNQGAVASGVTVEANNTTILTGGTNVVFHAESWNIHPGWNYLPTPEDRFMFSPATRCVVRLEAAVADDLSMSGTIIWEELGG